jgi:hypothetical protein
MDDADGEDARISSCSSRNRCNKAVTVNERQKGPMEWLVVRESLWLRGEVEAISLVFAYPPRFAYVSLRNSIRGSFSIAELMRCWM